MQQNQEDLEDYQEFYGNDGQYSDSSDSDQELGQIEQLELKLEQDPVNLSNRNEELLNQYTKQIHLDRIPQASHSMRTELKSTIQMQQQTISRIKDKKDRATVEQVLDPRTRVILVKLLNKKLFTSINGCVSTGKEANVYHAENAEIKEEFAVKIFKTSILIFKDRNKYVEGEFRFRKGHKQSNPRQMIKQWAEKEVRNLKRIEQSSINCPIPVLVKSNVLVMKFIGKHGFAAPRLRDALITDVDEFSKVYLKIIYDMRVLYQKCRLVHADLSEYNLLYYEKKVFMIDVSQSIEHDHPQAIDFLRRDILNINDFFKKKGVFVFGMKVIFDYITDINIKDDEAEEKLEELIQNYQEQDPEEEKLFAQAPIPRTLGEVPESKIQQDLQKMQEGKGHESEVLYQKLTGLVVNAQEINIQEKEEERNSGTSSESDENEPEEQKKQGGLSKYEGLSKKERKQKVKEEKREKRKEKMPKNVKKQLIKNSQK